MTALIEFLINLFLYIAYGAIIIGFALAILMPLITALIGDPSSLFKPLIGVAVLGVIFLIGYLLSGNEVTEVYATFGVDAGLSKTIGGALTAMYILIFVLIGGLIVGEISKLFK